jgi:hypothetical protein
MTMRRAPVLRILTVSLHRSVFDQEVADCARPGGYRAMAFIQHKFNKCIWDTYTYLAGYSARKGPQVLNISTLRTVLVISIGAACMALTSQLWRQRLTVLLVMFQSRYFMYQYDMS